MNIIAVQKSVRHTARKVNLVVRALKDLPLDQAIVQLGHIQRRATLPVLKVVRQAVANAQHNHGLTIDQLKLQSIEVTSGAQYKRFRAVSRGRAHGIVKKTSHIKVTLSVADTSTKSAVPVAKVTTEKKQQATKQLTAEQTTSVATKSNRKPAGVVESKEQAVAPTASHRKVAPVAPVAATRQSHQRRGSK